MQHFPLLYDDASLMVINKPYGVVVNRAESVKDETVQDWAEQCLKVSEVSNVPKVVKEESEKNAFDTSDTFATFDTFSSRAGIVHRIDKETSGCLIIAKNPEAFAKLQAAFKERTVHKTYIALVHGDIPQEGEINVPVGRLPWNKEQFGVVPGGKESRTVYKKTQNFTQIKKGKEEKYSLLELNPETGRTHQIRVHLKYLGYPIVGDYLYAGRKQQKADRVWCPRVFLHAAKVTFPHPVSGELITAEAPLPSELNGVLGQLTS